MAIKVDKAVLIVTAGFMAGFLYAGVKSNYHTPEKSESVVVIKMPTEPIDYVEYINDWSNQLTLALVEFETQTLTLSQDPRLYTDKEMMDNYSQVISEIMTLTTDLVANPVEIAFKDEVAHKLFKDSATAYNQAMASMWNVATFYQLDVNSDIINQSFEESINHLKTGMDLFQEGVSALR